MSENEIWKYLKRIYMEEDCERWDDHPMMMKKKNRVGWWPRRPEEAGVLEESRDRSLDYGSGHESSSSSSAAVAATVMVADPPPEDDDGGLKRS